MNVLFVCTANICRSFLAERLFLHEAEQLGLSHVRAASAGMSALPGNPPDPRMVAHLMEKGIHVGDHQSRQVELEELEWANKVLVMSPIHKQYILDISTEGTDKVDMLGRYAAVGDDDDEIADPFGRTPIITAWPLRRLPCPFETSPRIFSQSSRGVR